MPKLVKDLWPAAVLALGVLGVLVLAPLWQKASANNRAVREATADPHHIAGGLYFVGTPTDASFLLVGPEGDVLISGGATSYKVLANIEQLGFGRDDVKVLLASDPHPEEAGELADLQKATGAELWASNANADVIARGGKDDPSTVYTPHKLLAWAGVMSYPAPRVDHRVQDGETIRLGPLAITAHLTPGHAPGCTTWTFTVRDRDRDLHVVHRCSLTIPFGFDRSDLDRNPGVRADFERSFRLLRTLPVDIWLTSRGIEYGRYRKYQASLDAEDPAAAFIDRDGYLTSIDEAEAKFRTLLADD